MPEPVRCIRSLCTTAGLIFAAGGVWLWVGASPASAQEEDPPAEVQVVVDSGRTFQGVISPATDAQALHLRLTKGGISLTRPIAWHAIRQVEINSEEATLEDLVLEAVKVREAEVPPPATSNVLELGPSPRQSEQAEARWVGFVQPEPSPRVAYVRAWAEAKSWDRDAALDGLEVTFAAYDTQGHAIAVEGHLDARLYSFQAAPFHHVPKGLGARLQRIGTWRVPLQETFSWGDQQVARLEYQGLNPATNGSVAPVGVLTLTLVVPGQGTFSTNIDDVRLRPYSAFRDANQLRGGKRYFAGENPRYRPYTTP